MPFLAPLFAAAAAAGTAAFVATVVAVNAIVITAAVFAAKGIAAALTPDFASRARNQTVQIKQSAVPHRLLYGERRISGAITFIEVTDNDTPGDREDLNLIITICAHQVEEIGTVFLDNYPIYTDQLDGSGNVSRGRYHQVVQIQKHLGDPADSAQPFPDLVTKSNGKWTAAHLQRGHTKIWISLKASRSIRGVPNISMMVKGAQVLDNRVGGADIWTPSPSMCMRDYILRSMGDSGIGALSADIDTTTLDSSANTSDEMVDTLAVDHFAAGGIVSNVASDVVDTSTDEIFFYGDDKKRTFLEFNIGDKVQLFDVATALPTGLAVSTDYYAIPTRQMRFDERVPNQIGDTPPQIDACRMKLASSYANALAGTAVNITALNGATTFTVRKLAEPRYTCNYLIEVNREPQEILTEMASSMNPLGGGITRIGGSWFFNVGAWIAPTVTLDEDDTISPIRVVTGTSRKDRANAVTGLFISLQHFEQATTYPEVKNSLYLTEDGEKLTLEVNLPATNRSAAAQRMAKIILEDARQDITFTAQFKMSALQLKGGSNFIYDNARFGWSGKAFRAIDLKASTIRVSAEGGESKPAHAVETVCKETASAIYDWSAEETLEDLSTNTDLPDPFYIAPPTSIQIAETRAEPSGARVVSVTTVSWKASVTSAVTNYELEYKLDADSTWIFHTNTTSLTTDIIDLTPGLYNFRARALNILGIPSARTTHTQEIFAPSDKPADVTGLSVIVTEGLAHATWNLSTDLSVTAGGTVEIRHDSDTSTPDWANTVGIGSAGVAGNATQATVPLRDGHLLVKFVDVFGNKSLNAASVKVLQVSANNWTTIDTATEHTAFLGAKTNLVVAASKLKLDLDGSGDVFPTGDYTFNTNSIDLGSARNIRVTPTIAVVATLVNDLIDSRSDNVDDWLNWDGIEGSECDVRNEMRTTLDDPTGAPSWTAWLLLDANVTKAWGLEYRSQFTSSDDDANIEVSALSVKVEERLAL